MKFKTQLIIILICLSTIKVVAQEAVNQNENSDISNLPEGISYQWGASPHNSDWTYPFGTKITVNHNAWRNFEISTTARGSGCSTFLTFRMFDANNDVWFPWRRILVADQDGSLALGQNCGEDGYMLTVNGKILAEEVKVQNVPSSDYVFEPDYNLKSLKEVESFIRQNKHLPDIPSSVEFKEKGVGLGEMDDMLLRKIEELTLYTLEQEKRLEANSLELKAKSQKLEAQNSQLEAQQNELAATQAEVAELRKMVEMLVNKGE